MNYWQHVGFDVDLRNERNKLCRGASKKKKKKKMWFADCVRKAPLSGFLNKTKLRSIYLKSAKTAKVFNLTTDV